MKNDNCKQRLEALFDLAGKDNEQLRLMSINSAKCMKYKNPMKGGAGFDSFAATAWSIFQIFASDDWYEMMYLIRESEETYAYDFVFYALVIFGSYMLIKTVVMAQVLELQKVQHQEQLNKRDKDEDIRDPT